MALVLTVGLIAARVAPSGRVYTVAKVRVGLANYPKVWIGRVVSVRGVFVNAVELGQAVA